VGLAQKEVCRNQEHPMNWNSKFKIRLRVTANFLSIGAGSVLQVAAVRAQCWCMCKSDTEWALQRCKGCSFVCLRCCHLKSHVYCTVTMCLC